MSWKDLPLTPGLSLPLTSCCQTLRSRHAQTQADFFLGHVILPLTSVYTNVALGSNDIMFSGLCHCGVSGLFIAAFLSRLAQNGEMF